MTRDLLMELGRSHLQVLDGHFLNADHPAPVAKLRLEQWLETAWNAWKQIDGNVDTAKFRLGADLAKEYSAWLISVAKVNGSYPAK